MSDEPKAPISLDDIEKDAWAAIEHAEIANMSLFADRGFTPVLVLGLVQRLRKAEAIVRDFARSPKPVEHVASDGYEWGVECVLCCGRSQGGQVIHADSCPWRRAVESQP